ncbi:MAG: UDP-N-acetylglucosamine 2-epimerase (non-hydrolyzing) [Acidimicrobiia bacterium]|nr:UDP-N-acetylglucosamine 2-epimerase (non-hydrolyzing) [Acidimicrobiia bacterium]
MNVLFVLGTRPEAIKLCPVVQFLRKDPSRFLPRVCVTAQHRQMLDQVLEVFGITPDHDLNLMRPGQTLSSTAARVVEGLAPVLEQEKPDLVVVQGDTTTTFAGALAGFYHRIPVAHVEAGLRTGDIYQPFPEEMNRLLTTRLSALHFAATEWAADNLRKDGVDEERIAVTGNTGIDAVLYVAERLEKGLEQAPAWPQLDPGRKLIVVTAHRRENFGAGMLNLAAALRELARRTDVQIVYPVHPNPSVTGPIRQALSGADNILLIEPLTYVPFVDLMRRSYFLLTDSGGVQEEAPSLGKPVLVLRNKTERPEAVEAGTVKLVGTDTAVILDHARQLLEDGAIYRRMSRVHNPYGDGRSSERISSLIYSFHLKNKS